MSWLLDADVLSQPAKTQPDERVASWLRSERQRCYTSSIVIAQLGYWVRRKEGRSRDLLQEWLSRLVNALHGRIYSFGVSFAHVWADQQLQLNELAFRWRAVRGRRNARIY